MSKKKNTESPSYYDDLETKPVGELIKSINKEDHSVARIVKDALPAIEKLIAAILFRMRSGGRLFYIGAGTSGRLGVLDASELPPTYGVSPDMVQGIIAGGYAALTKSQEGAEDQVENAVRDLKD